MNLRTAVMTEPVIDEKGRMGLIILDDTGHTEYIDGNEFYNEDRYDKDDRTLARNLIQTASWHLPLKFNCYDYMQHDKDDLSKLHGRLCRYLKNYVWFSEENSYELVANWIISTYLRNEFRFAPILIFDGVTQSGKSTVLKTLDQVVYRGSYSSSYSAASLARQIESDDVTLLLDESLDTLQTERGLEVCSLIKSSFERGNMWIRADPKSMRVYKYNVYTSLAIAVKAEGLPEDVYNRGLRIGMVGMPEDLELGDIDSVHEDDIRGDCSPLQLRTELYALRWACMGGANIDDRPVDWAMLRKRSKEHFTVRIDKGEWKGEWYYGYVCGIKKAPRIYGRPRNIASTLYTIAMCTASDKPTIEAIIDSEKANREVIIDTPEALTFSAMVSAIFTAWETHEGLDRVGKTITPDVFDRVVESVSTTHVANEFNRILADQGNAGREPVQTKTVTSKILALGFSYKRGRQNRSYFDPHSPNFKPFFMRYLNIWAPEYLDTFDIPTEVNNR